jgi:hypothetical protein
MARTIPGAPDILPAPPGQMTESGPGRRAMDRQGSIGAIVARLTRVAISM